MAAWSSWTCATATASPRWCSTRTSDPAVHQRAEEVRPEYVIAVEGKVAPRGPAAVNPNLATGEVEVVASQDLDPERIAHAAVPHGRARWTSREDVRLKYRYVDLRRPHMQRNIMLRSKISFAVREFLYSQGFLEIETPFMTRSTPEGARDYLVPSRVQPGHVLRAAAIAADLQAAADGRRLREVFPDRALLPRRGSARRPPAGVHPDRSGDVVPAAGAHLRGDRADGGARVRGGRLQRQGALPAPHLRGGDAQLRHRQARLPDAAHVPGGGPASGSRRRTTCRCWRSSCPAPARPAARSATS